MFNNHFSGTSESSLPETMTPLSLVPSRSLHPEAGDFMVKDTDKKCFVTRGKIKQKQVMGHIRSGEE